METENYEAELFHFRVGPGKTFNIPDKEKHIRFYPLDQHPPESRALGNPIGHPPRGPLARHVGRALWIHERGGS